MKNQNLKQTLKQKDIKLTAFQFRVFHKLVSFSYYKIKYGSNAPICLKEYLSDNNKKVSYNLRKSTILKMQPDQSKSDYGTSTFKNFFC